MKNTEETHKLTETVYRGLSENFYPGIRHVVSCGKAYHKALIGVTAAAKHYTEALLKFGFTARSTCKGGTEDVGEAIYQIAETQREIQARIEENTKALFSELILPLEQKLDNEFRRYTGQHKKYTHGHKALISPYVKSHEALKKFRKKTKNKMVYDEHKEAQYVKILHKCQDRLDDYRFQGLKLALLEERKCHCFVLDRLSSMANMYALHHKQASDILTHKVPQWKQLSTKPHILPPSADKLLMPNRDEPYEHMNGVGIYRENGYLREDTRSLGSPYRRPASVPGVYRHPEGDFYSPEMYSRTLPPSRSISVPPAKPPGVLQVQGVYSHVGEGESKLSFAEGDIINLIGEKSDGWHYGQNTRSGKYGWFPLSFTEPVLIGGPPKEPAPTLQSRAKSLGELDNQSLSENSGYEQDIPGNIRRPKSMYDGSNLRLVNSTSQRMSTGWHDNPNNYSGYYSLPRQMNDHRFHPPEPSEQIYQFLHNDPQLQVHGRLDSSPGQPLCPPSPVFPPHPPPPPLTNAPPPTTSLSTRSACPSPALSRAASIRHNDKHETNSSTAAAAPPPPPPPPPPIKSQTPALTLSSVTTLSQNQASSSTTAYTMAGFGTPKRQQASLPPPIPPPNIKPPSVATKPTVSPKLSNKRATTLPRADYGMDNNDDSDYKRNPKFSNVNLRKTASNDRSAPKIN